MSLSEKILTAWITKKDTLVVPVEDVKEFIKRLKEELMGYVDRAIDCDSIDIERKIDELAGDKLIIQKQKKVE